MINSNQALESILDGLCIRWHRRSSASFRYRRRLRCCCAASRVLADELLFTTFDQPILSMTIDAVGASFVLRAPNALEPDAVRYARFTRRQAHTSGQSGKVDGGVADDVVRLLVDLVVLINRFSAHN